MHMVVFTNRTEALRSVYLEDLGSLSTGAKNGSHALRGHFGTSNGSIENFGHRFLLFSKIPLGRASSQVLGIYGLPKNTLESIIDVGNALKDAVEWGAF
jgi:hypothetical protein